jgi:hypothetical protein
MKVSLIATALFIAAAAPLFAQSLPVRATSPEAPANRAWFPHNWARGYVNFEVAPPHNEPDLGRCSYSPPGNTACSGYARYLWSGYLELQPLGRTFARHIFLFYQPIFSFGNNVPQLKYTVSFAPIALDRSIGVGFKLPKNFEVRITQHQVDFLGKYSGNLGPADLHTNGPYGLYATAGVRWYFGGYGQSR